MSQPLALLVVSIFPLLIGCDSTHRPEQNAPTNFQSESLAQPTNAMAPEPQPESNEPAYDLQLIVSNGVFGANTTSFSLYLTARTDSVAPDGRIQYGVNDELVRSWSSWWSIANWGTIHPKPLGRSVYLHFTPPELREWLGRSGVSLVRARTGSVWSNPVTLGVSESGVVTVIDSPPDPRRR